MTVTAIGAVPGVEARAAILGADSALLGGLLELQPDPRVAVDLGLRTAEVIEVGGVSLSAVLEAVIAVLGGALVAAEGVADDAGLGSSITAPEAEAMPAGLGFTWCLRS
ncbi:hypothetical protein [Frigoribacterium sp. CFBP 13707]|uniref:hypothetical protein n=1 Tax=Frigoribacterium sp. CFBP 13707 TaxID=2775313 RepID=UPI00177D888D|nr:hypothetical protein [Frigoribacterium sp. CFBP 13707]MBD8726500.1 hypothetical protein [Frigoribacterium sp. CFBP 13707]